MHAKRWNERVKLVMTSLNAIAITIFGLAVIAPILAHLTAAAADPIPLYDKLGLSRDFPWWTL